jgi:2-polyprenyl-3-methyl-5-hydroxy-6-metoxy-1,4-benzoquinol methylase
MQSEHIPDSQCPATILTGIRQFSSDGGQGSSMDIEEYARRHRHFWDNVSIPSELKFILDNNYNIKTLIDIGCGDGALLYKLKSLGYLDKVEVWAVDASETRLNSVKQISAGIVTVQDDAQFLANVPDSYFDLIVTTQVIEHVDSDLDMIRSISRISKPCTIVYLDTIFKKSYGKYFYRNKYHHRVLDPTHEREYSSENALYDIIRENGFTILHSKKDLIRFSILNFFFRKFSTQNRIRSKIISRLAGIKVPIPGYFCWKILMVKH